MRCLLWIVVLLLAPAVGAEGLLGDVLAGKLFNPEVGAYAVYRLTDAATGQRFFLRQAIVGKERVKGKTGWWLENELTPQAGWPVVYRMLVTGPASDPANVHEIAMRQGTGPIEHLDIGNNPATEAAPEAPREEAGAEQVVTLSETIEARRWVVKDPKTGAVSAEIWINESIPPMGIVKMASPEGELILQRRGTGGKDGESAIAEADLEKAREARKRRRER